MLSSSSTASSETVNLLSLKSVGQNMQKIQEHTRKSLHRSWLSAFGKFNVNVPLPAWLKFLLQIALICGLTFVANWLFVNWFLAWAVHATVGGFQADVFHFHHPYIEPDTALEACMEQAWVRREQTAEQWSLESALSDDCKAIRGDDSRNKIPRIIHQTYKSLEQLPTRWQQTTDAWKYYHSDWEYRFWGDDDIASFLEEHYSWFVPFYRAYPNPIQKADIMRYFVLFHFGGFYSDFDILPATNIEPLLVDYDVVLFETPNLGLTNSIFGAKKGSDFLAYLIDNLSKYTDAWYWMFLPRHASIILSTGPTMMWTVYSLYATEYSNKGPLGDKGKAYNSDVNTHADSIGLLRKEHYGRHSICDVQPKTVESRESSRERRRKRLKISSIVSHAGDSSKSGEGGKQEGDGGDENDGVVIGDLLETGIGEDNAFNGKYDVRSGTEEAMTGRRLEEAHSVQNAVEAKAKENLAVMSQSMANKCVAHRYAPYFTHTSGNSWHDDFSFFINFYIACHPVNAIFIVSTLVYSAYVLFFKNKSASPASETATAPMTERPQTSDNAFRLKWIRGHLTWVVSWFIVVLVVTMGAKITLLLKGFDC